MRKILVLASVAAVALSSCNKTEPLTGGKDTQVKGVSFDTYLGRTKGVSKDAFKMGDQFCTFGVKTSGANFDLAAPLFTEYVFNNTSKSAVVSHLGIDPKTNTAIWNYGDPTPWDEQKATFFAFSPVPQGASTFGITNPTIADNSIPTIDFEVVGGYDPTITNLNDPAVSAARELIKTQADLMWAYAPDNTKASEVIQLEFRHALSQIRFSARGYHNQGLLRINSITIVNALTKGKLDLANDIANSGKIDYLGGWKTVTDPKSFAVNLQTEAVSAIPPHVGAVGTVPTTWPVTDDDESLMMIPQALTGLKLEVRYSYSEDGKVWNDYESGSAMDFVLSTLSSHWNPNMRYNYILSIYPGKAIRFTSTIDAWEPFAKEADLEYRKFDALASGGSLTKADGTAEKFTLNEDDKIKTTYDVGADWIVATDKTGAKHILNGTVITVAAGNAGQWEIETIANDNVTARTGTVVIERAGEKINADGSKDKIKAGVAKYVISQNAGLALVANSVVYGGKNGTIVTGLDGFTLKSYSNALGTTALATEANIYTTEKPVRRARIAMKDAGVASSLAAAITACGAYSEAGAAAGKWRVARASELKLHSLNKTVINSIVGFTALANAAYWSTSLQTAGVTSSYWTINFATNTMAALVEDGTNTALVRCVFEEK